MAWTIEFAESVRRNVEKLDSDTRKRIKNYLDQRIAKSEDPRSHGKPGDTVSVTTGSFAKFKIESS